VDALIAALVAATGWRPRASNRDDDSAKGDTRRWPSPARDLTRSQALLLVGVITLIGIGLRVYGLGSDLWLDEIATADEFAARPLLSIFGSYSSPGNHLLNSILVHISMAVFGTSEWSVRLPAVLFGMATVPAMYLAARLAMSRAASVAATLLLAVSYHHIFFSQNSRGYSAYLLWILVGSILLASLLKNAGGWRVAAYVVVMSLAIVSLMSAVFAVVAHAIICAITIIARVRKGIPVRPLVERLVIAFAAIGFLVFHVYGIAIPDVLTIYPKAYHKKGSGFFFFSGEFVSEMIRGVSVGFASGTAAILVLVGAAAGFIVLARRNWVIAFSLAGTVATTIVFLLLRGQSIAPRILIACVPLAVLCLMATVDAFIRSPRIALAAGAALAALSVFALPSYYSAPKQPFRAAISYIESVRKPEQKVIVAYPASRGIRFYVMRDSTADLSNYLMQYNRAAFAPIMANPSSKDALLVTTLFHALRSDEPEVAATIEREWAPFQNFRGTLGGGNITIWRRKT
jgi:uncharacterized membrane protein